MLALRPKGQATETEKSDQVFPDVPSWPPPRYRSRETPNPYSMDCLVRGLEALSGWTGHGNLIASFHQGGGLGADSGIVGVGLVLDEEQHVGSDAWLS